MWTHRSTPGIAVALGPEDGFPASTPGLGNSGLGQAQVVSPSMPSSTAPSHCPGVSPHFVPPTDTPEDWGQNLACGIASWPGSGIFPALSIISSCLDPPPSRTRPTTWVAWLQFPQPWNRRKPLLMNLFFAAEPEGAVPCRGDPHPAQAGSWTRWAPPFPLSGAFRKRSGWRGTSFRVVALSRHWGPRRVRRTGHTQRKTLSLFVQVRSSRRL